MEDKNVQKLLDMLFGMIDEAKGATFSSEKCVINRDEALDLLDEIRNKLPGELTKAQELMKSKEQYVDKANHEVRRMLDQAQDEGVKPFHILSGDGVALRECRSCVVKGIILWCRGSLPRRLSCARCR